MAIRHLNQIEVAARWNISHRTLERWRWTVSDAPPPFGVPDDLRVLVGVPSARASIRRCASAASHSPVGSTNR
jgi:hypothetical protein